jgi:uncharacterized damage-inducible protein DinB
VSLPGGLDLRTMNAQLARRLARTNALFADLVATLTPVELRQSLPGLPSNSIGAQLWCVVGARESYLRAAEAGSLQGFACSLDGEMAIDPPAVLHALASSAAALSAFLADDAALTDAAADFLLDLLEHESQHHGQLIRYLYALGIPRPASWKARYALE